MGFSFSRASFLALVVLHFLRHDFTSSSARPLFPEAARPTKSGFLPVNSSSSSSMFYAFYEAQTPSVSVSRTPLLVWIQGGTGTSSMLGNFLQIGPWRVDIGNNPGAWNRIFGLLFLDNPIGTGFSVAATEDEIPRNQRRIAQHLYAALSAFIKSNKGFESRPLYIAGVSYAGKYVSSIAYYILKEKPDGCVKLRGVAIGNALIDPETQFGTHAATAYYLGLIDGKQREELEKAQDHAIGLIRGRKWNEAREAGFRVSRILKNMTGVATLADFTRKAPYDNKAVEEFLNNTDAKKALGVNPTFHFQLRSAAVRAALSKDSMQSVKYKVDFLVRTTRVLLYQGQLDLLGGVFSTEVWMRKLKWQGLPGFQNSDRNIWRDRVGGLAGYVRYWKNLSHVVVLGAGHDAPIDQPMNSQKMIEDWVLERGMFDGDRTDTLYVAL